MSSRYVNATKVLPAVAAALVLMLPAAAWAANYPLELVSPRAAGSAPASGQPALDGNNRVFWAYPGIEYNVKAIVHGGAYPYTFSLSNAPAGMTIDSVSGEIRWTSPPSSGSVTPTITVRDAENATVNSSWTITVDPGRFIFLDAANGRDFDASSPGTGTLQNPYRRIRDLYSGDVYAAKGVNTHVNKIAYFRNGTYFIDGYIEDANGTNYGGRMAVLDTNKPVAWIAYPGHSPTVDGQCRAMSPQIGSRGCNIGRHIAFYGNANNSYIDGLTFVNMARHAFQISGIGDHQTFRRNRFSVLGPSISGVNEAFIMTMAADATGDMGSYLTVQDNVFENIDAGACVKLYSVQRVLIEGNVCRNGVDSTGGNNFEGFAIKGGTMNRVTVRRNTIHDVDQKGIGGNMNTLQSGEFLYNLVHSTRLNAVDINQDGVAGPVFIYRNTFVGQVRVRNTDSSDGPFHFSYNIIINNDPGNHIYTENVSDPSRIRVTDNLVGTPSQGILDSSYRLTSAYGQYRNTHGFESPSAPPPPTGGGTPTAPAAPRNVRIVP
jgi:hypothetical protein